jgi:hypothetical protein
VCFKEMPSGELPTASTASGKREKKSSGNAEEKDPENRGAVALAAAAYGLVRRDV